MPSFLEVVRMGFWSRLFGAEQAKEPPRPPSAVARESSVSLERARELFLAEVLAIVRADERVESAVAVPDDFAIRIGPEEDAFTLFLHNSFLELREVPHEERPERVRALLDCMLNREPAIESWDEVAPRIRGAVRSIGYFGALAHEPTTLSVLARPFLPFLVETAVVDYPDKMTGVTLADVERWGVSPEEAFAAARTNVADLPTAVSPYDGAGGSIQVVDMGDHYEAARLLVPPLLLAIAKTMTGRLVIAIPHRSIMLLADDARDEDVLRLAEIARKEYEASPRSLSPALYTIDGEGRSTPYTREGRTPVANAVALGQYHLADAEYGQQKTILDKVHESNGTDEYVAPLNIVRVIADGHHFSYAVWGEEVLTLLPRADYVAMAFEAMGGKPCFVPWDTAKRLAASCWEIDEKLDPVRVRTVRWPDAAVLEQLRANAVDER